MCINTREYIRDENNLNYHLITVTSYEFMEKKSAFPQKKEDTKNDGRHKKKYG